MNQTFCTDVDKGWMNKKQEHLKNRQYFHALLTRTTDSGSFNLSLILVIQPNIFPFILQCLILYSHLNFTGKLAGMIYKEYILKGSSTALSGSTGIYKIAIYKFILCID